MNYEVDRLDNKIDATEKVSELILKMQIIHYMKK